MKAQSTGKGFAILSAAGMIVKVLSILYIYFLLKIIGDEGYGIYSAAYQVYVFIYVLTNTGIPVAISKLISEYVSVRDYKSAVKSFKIARLMLLVLGIVMSLILVVSAVPLVKILGYEKSYIAIVALAPAVLLTSVASCYRGYFQGRGNMTPTAVSQVIEQIMNTIFTLVFAALLMKYGVEWGCAGGTIGTTLGALFSAGYLMNYYRKNKKFQVETGYKAQHGLVHSNKALIKKIIAYGVPITVCIGMTYAGNLVDLTNTNHRLIAGGFSKIEAYIKYGYLVKYQQLLNVPIAMVSALAVAILPAIAGANASNNREVISEKINYAVKLCFLITIPAAVGLSVLSKPIFTVLFTKQFVDGSDLMMYGSVVLILMSLAQIQTSILQGIGKLYAVTLYAVIGIAAKIASNYFLIAVPSINIRGAVYGSMIGFAIPIILNHRIIVKTLNVRIGLMIHTVKPLLSSAFMGLVVYCSFKAVELLSGKNSENYIVTASATVVSVILGVYCYMIVIIFIKGVKRSELNIIPRKFLRVIPAAVLNRID
jgi:stage V sporulation protein B